MAEKYLTKLERLWNQNRKTSHGSTLQKLFEFPLGTDLERAKSLRGPDFVNELVRLEALTGDTRFRGAIFALFEHEIVGNKFKFLPWEAPAVAEQQKQVELTVLIFLCWTRSRGAPLRRTCAQLAALLGWPATSFVAAMKDLELIYRRHLAGDWCYSPDEFKFMCDLLAEFAAIEERRRDISIGISA
jgi:hypothetical protein